jgi:hypothetical protein
MHVEHTSRYWHSDLGEPPPGHILELYRIARVSFGSVLVAQEVPFYAILFDSVTF